jgi:3-methyladenine DNA glycosylase AlkD
VLLGQWFDGGVRNWGHTDVICGEIIGKRLADGAIKPAVLAGWRSSPHKYKRRAVPVSLINLVKTGSAAGPLLQFVEPLMLDSEKFVQQGMGWFLRECWKKDPAPVEEFLLKYRETAPRLIFQYATDRMSAAGKQRFRRTKGKDD